LDKGTIKAFDAGDSL